MCKSSILSVRRGSRLVAAITLVLMMGALAASASAQGAPIVASPGTSDKPQSKIWYNDGYYWAILQTFEGSHFFKLVQGSWIQQDFIDAQFHRSKDGREDVLWNGSELFVIVHDDEPRLYKYSYQSVEESYLLLPGFPVTLAIESGSETIVIDQDSRGRLWAVYAAEGTVYAAYSQVGNHLSWTTPGVVLRTEIHDDDIATLVHFGGNRIGVFWTDQERDEFAFRYHFDPNRADDWSSVEIVDAGGSVADDHVNLKADLQGRVFAVTKDDSDEFAVYRRNVDGSWSSAYDISNGLSGTRPILMLDVAASTIYAFYTCWSCEGAYPIAYHAGSMETLAFGPAQTFLSNTPGDKDFDSVTGMKQVLPPGSLVAISEADNVAYWNGWGSPPGGNGIWYDGAELPPPPPDPPGAPTALIAGAATRAMPPGVTATYLFDESGGETVLEARQASAPGTLGAPGSDRGEPQRIAGKHGNALRFDGIDDFVEIPDSPMLRFSGSFTVEAWVRRSAAGADEVIAAKEGNATRNYRVRIRANGTVELSWIDTFGGSRYTVSTNGITDSNWHHVACVHDQIAGEDRIYIDGVLEQVREDAGIPGTSSDPLYVGARKKLIFRDHFAGDLDMLRFSERAIYGANFTPESPYSGYAASSYMLVTWSAPRTGGAVVGYYVYRSINGGALEKLNNVPVAGLSYSDPIAVDALLHYQVSAINRIGEEGEKSEAISVVAGRGPRPPETPLAPSLSVTQHYEPAAGSAILNFDEAAGSTVGDASMNAYSGWLGDASSADAGEPAWVQGFAGTALQFDGIDDRVEIDGDDSLRMSGSFTLEAWINRVENFEYSTMISKEGGSARNFRFSLLSSGALQLYWETTSDRDREIESDAVVPAGAWHHVAAVHDQEHEESRLYIDGQLVGREETTGTPGTGKHRLRIGARQSSSSVKYPFMGRIDLVRVSAAALYEADFVPPTDYSGRDVTTHRLAWSAPQPGSAPLAGYHVYRSQLDAAYERVTSLPWTALEFSLEAPELQKTCYRVSAIDELGIESELSPAQCVDPQHAERDRGSANAHDHPHELLKAENSGLRLRVGPNPFNPSTEISLHLDEPRQVNARVYDVSGRLIRVLASGLLERGSHRLLWDGRDQRGRSRASGIYLLRIQLGRESITHKLILAK